MLGIREIPGRTGAASVGPRVFVTGIFELQGYRIVFLATRMSSSGRKRRRRKKKEKKLDLFLFAYVWLDRQSQLLLTSAVPYTALTIGL
jgi:hypothetical protein